MTTELMNPYEISQSNKIMLKDLPTGTRFMDQGELFEWTGYVLRGLCVCVYGSKETWEKIKYFSPCHIPPFCSKILTVEEKLDIFEKILDRMNSQIERLLGEQGS